MIYGVSRGKNTRVFARLLVLIVAIIMATSAIMVAMSTPFLVYADNAKNTEASGINLVSPSAILMEASTGQIIYEKNADEALAPASVTKVMTLLLIFDYLKAGKITLDEEVTVSEHAASMGGSQVFLEVGEKQTVNTMIKCISMASANDACVAMGEHLCGTEEAFVNKMNDKAKELGMVNTNFVNCCGLDVEGHKSSARDIAIMSRELIVKHPEISEYSTVWMDTIIHSTRRGEKEFVLTNTNKLIKQYEWATGLKTGSTSKAGCCLAATAKKDGIELIAVVLAAPNSKTRFAEAISLMNYGYSSCDIYVDDNMMQLEPIKIKKGKKTDVTAEYEKTFSYLFMDGFENEKIERKLTINDNIEAPVNKGDVLGYVEYSYDGKTLGKVNIISGEEVLKAGFTDTLHKLLDKLLF